MQIFCKTVRGETTILEVEPTDTILRLKDMLYAKDGVPSAYQRLIFGGKHLNDSLTIADYRILKESTIEMTLKL